MYESATIRPLVRKLNTTAFTLGIDSRYRLEEIGRKHGASLGTGPKYREAAVKALRKFGPAAKDAVPALTQALKDQDKTIRIAAAYCLGELGPEAAAAVPVLTEMAKEKDGGVHGAAVHALRKIQPKQ